MKYTRTFFRVLLVLGMVGALVFARDQENGQSRYKTASPAADGPALTTLNINNIEVWLRRDAAMPPDGANGACADYPKGITNLIYAEGMVWGVEVEDGVDPVLRVGGSTYNSGMKAGKVLGPDGNHWQPGTMPGGSEIEGDRHVWRVRTDWKSANLADDAASFFQSSTATEGELAEVVAQYEYDWMNWPDGDGAPFNDLDGDGVYTPATWDAANSEWINGDIPGFPGADQTLWVVSNDIPYADGAEIATSAYGSPGVGFEEQLTVWGYNFPASFPLGNIQFKRARMIYTGRPDGDVNSNIGKAYFTQWSDPDLGTYTDDYVGFDLDLSLAYVYNGNTLDATYNGVYGLAVPAGGYDFLQGPKVDGVPLGMTSTGWFGAGSNDTDPDLREYTGTLQWWNLMEGFRPDPYFPDRLPWIDNVTGEETITPLAGDPVTSSGDVDGLAVPPGDRRMLMNSGPFEIALGDTQDVVIGLIGATGGDNLSSITVLKYYDQYAQYAYDLDFDLPSAPSAPSVETTASDQKIILNWGSNPQAVAATEGVESKGFAFQGYKVYQLPNAGAAADEGKLIAIYDVIDITGTIIESVVDPETGFLLQLPVHLATNSGVKRYLEITTDALKNRPLSNDIPYYYGISAYSYLADNVDNSPFTSLESSMSRVTVTPNQPAPGVMIPTESGDDLDITHNGTSGGDVTGTVIDPLALTGDNYAVWFDNAHYYLDVDGKWKPTAEPDAIAKLLDISGSTVTGAAVVDPPGIALHFEVTVNTTDYDCAQGALIEIPGAVITGVSSADGIAYAIQPDGSSVLFGDVTPDGHGAFCGGNLLTINVDGSSVAFPLAFNFVLYDDNWATLRCDPDGDGVVDAEDVEYCANYSLGPGYSVSANAEGTGTIAELGYSFQTFNQWNLDNVTKGQTLLAGQTNFNGTEYSPEMPDGVNIGTDAVPIVDGLQVSVDVGFAAPLDFQSSTYADGSSVCLGTNAVSTNDCDIMIDSYEYSGWAAGDAWAINTYGAGTTSISVLQSDIKVVFDGVYGDPIPTGFGGEYYPVVEGGQMAWLYQGSDLAIHPENPNPGTDAPFLLRLPFTLWNVEDPDNVYQIGMIMRDRIQPYDGSDPDLYGFNIQDRMYTYMIDRPYEETLNDFESNEAFLSWNHVWWRTLFEVGQEITFTYGNPTQLGVDEWVFSTSSPTVGGDITDEMIDMINVFPNPYYGFQELETTRRDKYVRFNHLPQKADIRIFNMGGVMVRKIEKDDATQTADWDLTNQYSLPVASGVYIAHIDLPDVGKEKILKIALVQEEQILLSY